jgi:hypothetical protein
MISRKQIFKIGIFKFIIINGKIFSNFPKESINPFKYKALISPACPLVSWNVIQILIAVFDYKGRRRPE